MEKSTTDAGPGEIVYRIDAQGRVAYVSEAWDAFAVDNDAPELRASAVLGRPLAEFISDPETRHIVDSLVRRAGESGRTLQVSFRCDAPHERRRLQMTVTPLEDGGTEFRTRPQRLDLRPDSPLLNRQTSRTGDLLTMCSWCNRVRVGGNWDEIEVAVDRLALLEAPALPGLTHGICEECSDQLMRL
jgi:hypothetical protein